MTCCDWPAPKALLASPRRTDVFPTDEASGSCAPKHFANALNQEASMCVPSNADAMFLVPPPPAPPGTWTGLKCASFRTKTVPKSLKAFVRVAGAAPLCQPHLDGRPGFAEQRAAGQQGRAKHVRRRKGGLLFNGEGWLLNALHARVFVLSKSCQSALSFLLKNSEEWAFAGLAHAE